MRLRSFVLGFLAASLLASFAGLAYAMWAVDIRATAEPGLMDACMARVSARAIRRSAPPEKNPFAADPSVLPVGLDHYKENCLVCHGAPGIEPAELAKGLHPRAPELTSAPVKGLSDSQLYWVVSSGIQMTGMPAFSPTHDPDEIWKIVMFVRHLPALTDAEKENLSAGLEGQEEHHHHHHGDEGGGATPGAAAEPATPAEHEATDPTAAASGTYAEAVAAIEAHANAIGQLIQDGKLGGLHHEAATIKKIADGMPALVTEEGSGVPPDARPEVLAAWKALAAMFPRIDRAGDTGNLDESRRAYADLQAQVTVLQKYAPR